MLATLTLKNHRHLVKLLATYRYDNKYHLLCPFADANLRTYWMGNFPTRDPKTYIWVLKEMAGLSSALHLIHDFKTGRPPPPDRTHRAVSHNRPDFDVQMNVDPLEALYGRHGDLKAENVLWSKDLESSDPMGTLQIADLGLGRFHRLESRSRQDPRTINGSPTYMPPELILQKLVSRAYDIWSLGCIFLEFITWLLQGPDGLTEFGNARMALAQDGVFDDIFYTFFKPDVDHPYPYCEVRGAVTRWIQTLRQHYKSSQMVRDVLDLIEKRMLLVESKERISAKELDDFFQERLQMGNGSDVYLLGGS